MAVSFFIDHISAVNIPATGGALWMLNWRVPCSAGAGIGLLSLVPAQFIRVPAGSVEEVKEQKEHDQKDDKMP